MSNSINLLVVLLIFLPVSQVFAQNVTQAQIDAVLEDLSTQYGIVIEQPPAPQALRVGGASQPVFPSGNTVSRVLELLVGMMTQIIDSLCTLAADQIPLALDEINAIDEAINILGGDSYPRPSLDDADCRRASLCSSATSCNITDIGEFNVPSCSQNPQTVSYVWKFYNSYQELVTETDPVGNLSNIFPDRGPGKGYLVGFFETSSYNCDINDVINAIAANNSNIVTSELRPIAEQYLIGELDFFDGPGSYVAGYVGTKIDYIQQNNRQTAETARLSLQSSLSAFMDHGSCLINWEDTLTAQASTSLGGNWSKSGDTDTRSVMGGLKVDAGKQRYCVSFDADASNELSKRSDNSGSNEVDVTQLKGTSALKVGLLRGEAKKQTAFLTDWYTVYSFISYGRGHSLTKDDPGANLTRTEANAWQVAGGLGFQAQGKVCGRYDLNAGYYTGQSDGETRSNGLDPVGTEGDTNGGTFSFSLDCPLNNYPVYWNAKVRHDTDDNESTTNYGVGVGYNITDNMRFELDWERTHVGSVINKTINANFVYDFFRR